VHNLTIDEVAQRHKGKIVAVGVKGQHPFEIDLTDVSEIHATKVRSAANGGSIVDTISADDYKREIRTFVQLRIHDVRLKSGEKIELNDRKYYFDAGESVIRIDGEEVVFDTLGGRLDSSTGQIHGKTVDGNMIDVASTNVAYVRLREADAGKTVLLVLGITGTAAGLTLLLIASALSGLD